MSKLSWIFAGTFGLILLPALGQAQNEAGNSKNGATEKQQPAQQLPIPLPVKIIEDDETAIARKASENETAQREKDDLVAQQGMHAATQAMNEATQSMKQASWVSAGLVLLGTGLLIWTLHLTRKANEAAQEAVKVTRDIGRAQVRAYVNIGAVGIENLAVGETPKVRLDIRNSGNSPAKRVKSRWKIAVVKNPHIWRVRVDADNYASSNHIGANSGQMQHFEFPIKMEKDIFNRLERGQLKLVVAGSISYETVFKQFRWTTFSFIARTSTIKSGPVIFDVTPKHNNSN